MTLEKIRKEIDALDDQMIDLLIRRMTLVEEVIIAKAEENRDVYDSGREAFILEKIKKRTEDPQYTSAVQAIYKEIMKHSREYQEKNRIK
ncbi:chorismate mutase [Lactococcus formosensis subsp. formosensis]|uniref:chorismate mutase n=1 Tax=Lactococcus formosensis TaxID=1281486 RepID=UPI0013FD982A|nr:chorismate mutase [Lactococcus formosensis]NHI68213.1 chorismate mutase [Lactococcus garvieae]MDT2727361.1 chorismate mutase [Lactococcus formosensis]NHI73818.1 chorismate mutase [Lactococcus garvieae]NHI99995.1 chorismate mutase [Lactococcus garvieae]NHJ18798.1 chorismate mutase [Lactococcus garvieae]